MPLGPGTTVQVGVPCDVVLPCCSSPAGLCQTLPEAAASAPAAHGERLRVGVRARGEEGAGRDGVSLASSVPFSRTGICFPRLQVEAEAAP